MKKIYINFCHRCKRKLILDKRYSRYLCRDCRTKANKYPIIFRLLKKTILSRDGYKCQCYSTNKKLIIHHIDFNKFNNKVDNLITLCNQCHMSLHKFYKKDKVGFIEIVKNKKFPNISYEKYGNRLLYN